MIDPLHPAIPAATLVLFRDRADGPALHLMIERASHLAFAPGALVFPGGRVEEDDHAIAANPALTRNAPEDLEDGASRVAAVREAIEETGVAVAVDPLPSGATIAAWRMALAEGRPFAELLAEENATLDLDQLVPFARWRPNMAHARLFDTRFYIARVDDDCIVEVDGGEATRFLWMSARQVLDDAAAGHHHIIFPTRCNLERLAVHPGFELARDHARTIPVKMITPKIVDRNGVEWLCIPDDIGYPYTEVLLEEALRG